ncbi:hypothetical protein [Paracoccus homiensis]|uniref:hypothetical protein n=1 Tax=Paracoccus homiensis TaxID=364199 RepID=UPI00398D53FB
MKKRTAVIALTLFVLAGCTAQTTGTAVEEASPYPIPNEVGRRHRRPQPGPDNGAAGPGG